MLRTCFLLVFWLPNLLRATAAWNFFIAHLARWLCTRCFSEPTFRPSAVTKHRKDTVLCEFSTFLHACIFCLVWSDILSSFLPSLLFSSLILPTSAFSSVHIVGSLTSKLRSVIATPCGKMVEHCFCMFLGGATLNQMSVNKHSCQGVGMMHRCAFFASRFHIILFCRGNFSPWTCQTIVSAWCYRLRKYLAAEN